MMWTISETRDTGIGRVKIASMRLKMALLAPMPAASESTAMSVKLGLARSPRIP